MQLEPSNTWVWHSWCQHQMGLNPVPQMCQGADVPFLCRDSSTKLEPIRIKMLHLRVNSFNTVVDAKIPSMQFFLSRKPFLQTFVSEQDAKTAWRFGKPPQCFLARSVFCIGVGHTHTHTDTHTPFTMDNCTPCVVGTSRWPFSTLGILSQLYRDRVSCGRSFGETRVYDSTAIEIGTQTKRPQRKKIN